MVADLEAGEIDVALMWGPIAGPMVKQRHPTLTATPLLREAGSPPMSYRITMGVRQGEDRLEAGAKLPHPASSGGDRHDPARLRGAAVERHGH
jgi:hypothetical protein